MLNLKMSACNIYAGGKAEYCNDFDLRKPLERHFYSGQRVDCISLRDSPNLVPLLERCSTFSAQISKYWHIPFFFAVHSVIVFMLAVIYEPKLLFVKCQVAQSRDKDTSTITEYETE